MCVSVTINQYSRDDFTVEYTPKPIQWAASSDEGIDCLNILERWFLAFMYLTLGISVLALFRAWNHRHDFKKVISPRYKWFGIDHGGHPKIRSAYIPRHSPEFSQPCHCFDHLGTINQSSAGRFAPDFLTLGK